MRGTCSAGADVLYLIVRGLNETTNGLFLRRQRRNIAQDAFLQIRRKQRLIKISVGDE